MPGDGLIPGAIDGTQMSYSGDRRSEKDGQLHADIQRGQIAQEAGIGWVSFLPWEKLDPGVSRPILSLIDHVTPKDIDPQLDQELLEL